MIPLKKTRLVFFLEKLFKLKPAPNKLIDANKNGKLNSLYRWCLCFFAENPALSNIFMNGIKLHKDRDSGEAKPSFICDFVIDVGILISFKKEISPILLITSVSFNNQKFSFMLRIKKISV